MHAPVTPSLSMPQLARRLLLCSFLWASGFLFMKLMSGGVSPLAMAGSRAGIAALALIAWALVNGDNPLPRRGEWRVWAVLGTLNGWLPNMLTGFALTQITAASSAMIQASGPLMVAVMAHLLFSDERLTRGRIVGVGLGFIGMGVLIGPDAFAPAPGGGLSALALGALAMTTCAACYASGNLFARSLKGSVPSRLALGQQCFSAAVALPLALVVDGTRVFDDIATHIGPVLGLGLAATALPITMFMILIHRAGPTKAAMVGYLMPVFATLLAVGFLGEQVGPREILGGLIILTGVYCVTTARKPQPR
jgi:drug/metabolite transporter (DMT)-like permease